MQALQAIAAIELIETPLRRHRPKTYRERSDPFSLPDEEFRKRYRFQKSTMAFIVDLVRQDLEIDRRGCGTSPELQVLSAVRCWGRREVNTYI